MDKSAPICFCIRTTQFTSFRNLCQPWNHTFFVWNWHHAYSTNNVHLFYRVNTRNPPSYEEKAGFFSKILFMWLNPLLTLGNKRTLNPEYLWPGRANSQDNFEGMGEDGGNEVGFDRFGFHVVPVWWRVCSARSDCPSCWQPFWSWSTTFVSLWVPWCWTAWSTFWNRRISR